MFDDFMSRMGRQGEYGGSVAKRQSDMIMDATFKNDIAFRKCYIQQHNCFFPEQSLSGYKKAKAVWSGADVYNPRRMNGFKPIDAKYFIHSYYSLSGDSVDYYLQFRPHAHAKNPDIRIGAYIFIPDDLGVYNLWMIVARDDRPQFPQFYILKCNLLLKWFIGVNEVSNFEGLPVDIGTYYTWAIERTQSSYNSGIWTDYATTTVENQVKAWIPTNNDTKTITYNERFVISDNEKRRIAWEVTKVEDTTTRGLTKLTFAQQAEYDPVDNLSWVNMVSSQYSDTESGYDYDFYTTRQSSIKKQNSIPEQIDGYIAYAGASPMIKSGGGYKTYTAIMNPDDTTIINDSWIIEYLNNDESLCEISLQRSDDQFIVSADVPNFVVNGNAITYILDGEVKFAIEYKYDNTRPTMIKLRCPYLMQMIGSAIKLTASNNTDSVTLDLEVGAL